MCTGMGGASQTASVSRTAPHTCGHLLTHAPPAGRRRHGRPPLSIHVFRQQSSGWAPGRLARELRPGRAPSGLPWRQERGVGPSVTWPDGPGAAAVWPAASSGWAEAGVDPQLLRPESHCPVAAVLWQVPSLGAGDCGRAPRPSVTGKKGPLSASCILSALLAGPWEGGCGVGDKLRGTLLGPRGTGPRGTALERGRVCRESVPHLWSSRRSCVPGMAAGSLLRRCLIPPVWTVPVQNFSPDRAGGRVVTGVF